MKDKGATPPKCPILSPAKGNLPLLADSRGTPDLSAVAERAVLAAVRALHPPGEREPAVLALWGENRRADLRALKRLLAWMVRGGPGAVALIPKDPPAWWREMARRAEEVE